MVWKYAFFAAPCVMSAGTALNAEEIIEIRCESSTLEFKKGMMATTESSSLMVSPSAFNLELEQ